MLLNKTIHRWQLTLVAAVFIVVFDNFAFWNSLFDLSGKMEAVNFLFIISVFIAVVGVTVILISLTAFKYVYKPLLILILLSAALADYYMGEYGILIDKDMVRNMFLTDRAEVLELLLSPGMLLHVLLFGVVPSSIVWKLKLADASVISNMASQLLMVVAALATVGVVAFVQYKNFVIVYRENRDIICRINPICPLVSVTKHIVRLNKPKAALHQIALDAVQASTVKGRKRNVVVLVVGETARAANFSLNNYGRNTNPLLVRADIINFDNVYSCGTSTAASLPCMFSHLTRPEVDDIDPLTYENLLDVLVRTGVDVFWRDNDAGCKGVCVRVPTEDLYFATHPEFCIEDNCYDEILLDSLDDLIRKGSKDLLIVMHQKGSHGPAYYRRYPAAFRQFTPECTIVEVQDCSRQEIVNSYDNTILYTDFVLSQLIEILDRQSDDFNTAMLYLSDHGESLGEKGLYLHGLPYFIAPDEQVHVPMILWLSEGYRDYMGLDQKCLHGQSHLEYSHDNLFSSVLGMFQVQTAMYKKAEDIFASCVSTK